MAKITLETIAKDLGITVSEEVFTQYDLYTADECFLTGTAAETIPVVKVDTKTIGNGEPGSITTLLLEEFRKVRIRVSESFGRDSLKVQLNRANKMGAKYTLILGQKEALDGVVIVRNMKNGKQDIVKIDKVVTDLKSKLKK